MKMIDQGVFQPWGVEFDSEASNLELQISHSSRSSPFMGFQHFRQVFWLGSGNEIDLH